ncbi:MAG: RICIN domain-containing protein [Clostridia bacterium]|nr:RICIN domain-containing protein [Clostridia bacterium]
MKMNIKKILRFALIMSLILSCAAFGAEPEYEEDEFNLNCFRISLVSTGKCIDVENASVEDSAKITAAESNESDSQIWTLISKGDNCYTLTNNNSLRSIDVPSSNMEAGTGLIQYATNGDDNQQIRLVKNDDGSYLLQMKHSNLYLTVSDGFITQEALGASENQRFAFHYIGKSDIKLNAVSATLFMLKGAQTVTNAKLQWSAVAGADEYMVYRSVGGQAEEYLDSLSGFSYDDYGLEIGAVYKYIVKATSQNRIIAVSESAELVPYELPDVELQTYSNIIPSSLNRPNSLYADGLYYRFYTKGRTDGGAGFGSLMAATSEDGITYGNDMEVLSVADILANPASEGIEDCRFESNNFIYNAETNMFYWWAHMEKSSGYGYARMSVAYGKPGERFVFGTSVRPEGDDARDLNVFIDDDNSAYIMAAIHGNADLALYKLTEDWTNVEKRLTIVNKGKWRELPSMIKKDGVYYLFSSGTAGWYPTQSMYNAATNLAGPWSELRRMGNRSTFSAQSGSVSNLKKGASKSLMITYRWMYYWKDAMLKRTTNRLMPLTFADGYAFFDFYNEALYNVDNDILIPVQNGRLLSQGKSATASSNAENAYRVNDGDYQTSWAGENVWPSTWSVDLGQVYSLSEIQISWFTKIGSEAYYNYVLEGSEDGVNYSIILDRADGYSDYGFTVDDLYKATARYVRLNIMDANPRNSSENTYTPEVFEVKIFGL